MIKVLLLFKLHFSSKGQSFNGVRLIVWIGNIIDFKFLKIFMYFNDVWPLGLIYLESNAVAKLGNQKEVSESNFVSDAVLPSCISKKFFESS